MGGVQGDTWKGSWRTGGGVSPVLEARKVKGKKWLFFGSQWCKTV